jgi:hypothetical protein
LGSLKTSQKLSHRLPQYPAAGNPAARLAEGGQQLIKARERPWRFRAMRASDPA